MKKLFSLLLLLSLLLTGCQLANPEAKPAALPDSVRGILLTTEPLTEPVTGNMEEPQKLFSQGDYFVNYYQDYEGEDYGAWTISTSDTFRLPVNGVNTVNDKSYTQIEAIFYVNEDAAPFTVYVNPICQKDGEPPYAIPGEAVTCDPADGSRELAAFGNPDKHEDDIRLTVEPVPVPHTYRLLQMDAANNLLAADPLEGTTFSPSEDCAYVILEADGKPIAVQDRQPGNGTLEVFYDTDGHLGAYTILTIHWEEETP